MPYLYRLRQWGIKNAPLMRKHFDESNLGVLRNSKMINDEQFLQAQEAMTDRGIKALDKVHSLFFPHQWREAVV